MSKIKFKDVMLVVLLAGFVTNSLFILRVFVEILFLGESVAREPNQYILWIETILALILFVGSVIFLKKNADRIIDNENI